ncbi:spore coat protein GerQ [Erysipelatoclostridium sp. An15]|uniref:spore coat protein GerQ n=1 Tax=unclassified Thomasclavelia TaxID=3025756 RepID=UPI000B3A46B5|nr:MULTISPECIES: spore coat protein GerQ [unclassified Thomasclavelia]OUP76881.1 spore coat protein GerQ [Erysipelatoclostridium sp. An173]OUQ07632.1 spore coat protein GerQ [Erysipelatoclostridium sp. An15]
MNYFNDLNPFLVRQENDNSSAENPSDSSTNPPPITTPPNTSNTPGTGTTMVPAPVIDQTYIENILRLNIGKLGTFYFTYSNSNEWRDKVYRGIIQQAGRDHFIIRDSKTNHEYLLQLVYFNWAEFDEPINYQHPYQ